MSSDQLRSVEPVALERSHRRLLPLSVVGPRALRIALKGDAECPARDPHTQIAVGLEQLVILTRATFRLRDR